MSKPVSVVQFFVSPPLAIAIIWIWQLFSYLAIDISLYQPLLLTWGVVFVGVLAFLVGVNIAYSLSKGGVVLEKNYVARQQAAEVLVIISLLAAIFSAGALTYLTEDRGFSLLLNIKLNLLEESASGNKETIYFAYMLIFNAICVLYYCSLVDYISSKKAQLLIVLTGVLCLFNGSRGLLVVFVVALLPSLVFHATNHDRKVLLLPLFFAISFVGFFFIYPSIFQGYEFQEGASDNFGGYLVVYLYSGISAFSHYLQYGSPSYDCFLMLPRPLAVGLDAIFSTGLSSSCPVLFDEIYVPYPTNVYSLFFLPMHDFGLLGVTAYLLLLGFVSGHAFVQGFLRNSVSWRFIYGILFYSILMSFFEDQFLKGFIYYFFAALVLVYFYIYKLITKTRRIQGVVSEQGLLQYGIRSGL